MSFCFPALARLAPHAALAGLLLLVGGCRGEETVPLPSVDGPAAEALRPRGPLVEVFQLSVAPDGTVIVSGMVPTPDARAVLLGEIGRRWPGRPVQAEVRVDPDAPASWVSEAVAMLSYVAAVEDGGLLVQAEAGAAGGGTLTLTGRVASDAALAALAEDAAASVAPPFVLLTPLFVGLPDDSTAVADSLAAVALLPAVVADAAAEEAATALRTALGEGPLQFEEGAATLPAEARAAVVRAARALGPFTDVRVTVAAPGGTSGSSSLDRALAARRAAALADALTAAGLDTARVAPGTDEPTPAVTFRLTTGDAAGD